MGPAGSTMLVKGTYLFFVLAGIVTVVFDKERRQDRAEMRVVWVILAGFGIGASIAGLIVLVASHGLLGSGLGTVALPLRFYEGVIPRPGFLLALSLTLGVGAARVAVGHHPSHPARDRKGNAVVRGEWEGATVTVHPRWRTSVSTRWLHPKCRLLDGNTVLGENWRKERSQHHELSRHQISDWWRNSSRRILAAVVSRKPTGSRSWRPILPPALRSSFPRILRLPLTRSLKTWLSEFSVSPPLCCCY